MRAELVAVAEQALIDAAASGLNVSAPTTITSGNVTLTIFPPGGTAEQPWQIPTPAGGDGDGAAGGDEAAAVTITSSAGTNASTLPAMGAIVFSGDVARAVADAALAADSTTGGGAGGGAGSGGPILISSSIIDIFILESNASSVPPGVVEISLPLAVSAPFGGGRCEEPSLFGDVHNPAAACVAGCCLPPDGSPTPTCQCSRSPEARGAFCDVALECSRIANGARDTEACHVKELASDVREVCVCRVIGTVGIFAQQIAPATTLQILLDDPEVLTTWLRTMDADWPASLIALSLAMLGALCITLQAYVLDRRCLWVRCPPRWWSPHEDGWRFATLFVHHLKL